MADFTYDDFTAYYGGTSSDVLRKYAEGETNTDRKEMFLRLAKELENGAIYVPRRGGQLSYQRINSWH